MSSISAGENQSRSPVQPPPPLPALTRSSPLSPSPGYDEFLVLSLSPVRCNRRLFLFCRILLILQPSALGLVARTFAQPSPQSFPPFLPPPSSFTSTPVAQGIRHLPDSRRPCFVHHPNRTDACRTIRRLIPIPNVRVHLPTDSPEIIPGPYQSARICACLACPLDPRPERLEIFIAAPPFGSGTRDRGGV